MLTDSFGRKLDYLRLSVTDRCNLRCVYCMPLEGVEWKPNEAMLSYGEILRLCRIMAELGIRKIKITGGEPLVRRGMASLIGNLKNIPGIESVTLTSNGFLLGRFLDEAETVMPHSLPDGVNISLDALDPRRFERITRTKEMKPAEVFPHIDCLIEKQIPVKINCVPVRGFNEDEIVPLAGLARDRNISVRFIELMPIGSASFFKPVTGTETAAFLEKAYGSLKPIYGVFGSGPAVYYSLPGFTGKIGFINPVSHGFCETCNRLRLTSEGILKPCLSFSLGSDLRSLLRSGASDNELANAILGITWKKPRFHTLSDVYGASQAEIEAQHLKRMFRIGG